MFGVYTCIEVSIKKTTIRHVITYMYVNLTNKTYLTIHVT